MQRLAKIILALFILTSGWIVYDRMTIPETTSAMIEAATLYAVTTTNSIPPKQFSYDGCTLIPEHYFGIDLNSICLQHDIAYWAGGTEADKHEADRALRDGFSASGNRIVALTGHLAYTAVHLLGDSFLARLLGRNWGHGYNQ